MNTRNRRLLPYWRKAKCMFDEIPEFDAVYHLGKQTADSPRPLLVDFRNQTDKDLILHNAARVKKKSEVESLWINRDHPELTRRQTANTCRCFNLMKANYHTCQMEQVSPKKIRYITIKTSTSCCRV